MDNREFLEGIDDQFQRLMKQQGNGKSNGEARISEESATARIIRQIAGLTHTQREELLAFIQSLKQKVGE